MHWEFDGKEVGEMNNRYTIKSMDSEQLDKSQAMDLVWKVFFAFEAPEYSDEGIREFKEFIAPHAVEYRIAKGELFVWGCFHGENIIGVIATRPPCHISLLFVDKDYHRQGIAKALYETVLDYYKSNSNYTEVTVNSSPYALEAYRRLGFLDTDTEQMVNGLRFVPMKHTFR